MRIAHALALVALFSVPAFSADLVITKSKHADAMQMMGQETPAKDSTEVTWIGHDRMRVEEGDSVTLVRADQKKMYILDLKAKTAATIELPFDMKQYVPAEQAEMMERFMGQMKVTVVATTETKKIREWNATKYTLTMSMPMGGGFTQEVWATKDIEFDRAAFTDLNAALLSIGMGGASIAAEFAKIDGLAVLTERTQTMMGQSSKSREEVTAVETKEAPEGLYDVPKDFTTKAFDPLAGSTMGGGRGRGAKPGATPPVEKSQGRALEARAK